MRIVGNIPHPKITISIFAMNDKYQVKFEAGPMEQIFKFYGDEVKGVDDIKKVIDADFLDEIMHRFVEMFTSFKKLKEKHNLNA
jgi:hypothetical protein